MPKPPKEPKPKAKTFEDVFVAKPEHDHCKQVLASKRIRDCCFTGWDTSREPYFPEDKGCYYLAANLEICPTTGREHWQGRQAKRGCSGSNSGRQQLHSHSGTGC